MASGSSARPDNSDGVAAEMSRLKESNARLNAKFDRTVSIYELEKRQRQSEADRERSRMDRMGLSSISKAKGKGDNSRDGKNIQFRPRAAYSDRDRR